MGCDFQSAVPPSGQRGAGSGRWSDGGGVRGEDEEGEKEGEGWRPGRQSGAVLHKVSATVEEGEGASDPDTEQQRGGRDQWRSTLLWRGRGLERRQKKIQHFDV